MKIAIHESSWGFSPDWIKYCLKNQIPYKVVNCYSNNIISELDDCNALLWHHHHSSAKDVLFAKELLFALQQSGKVVFPDFNTSWHFDDKLGQKYLLEAVKAPIVNTYAFYSKEDALSFVNNTTFPKVFKLRGGAGSSNVKLLRTKSQARKIISRAFGGGFPSYDRMGNVKENLRKLRLGKASWLQLLKSIRRVFTSTEFARIHGAQKGYVLLQDFMPGNTFDIRVVTIGNKAFGIKRMVRENDFRASGSGFLSYDKAGIDERCVQIAFATSVSLNAQVVAYDFVYNEKQEPVIVEINYGFAHQAYFKCPGYWDASMQWHGASFNAADLVIELIIDKLKKERK